MAKEGGISRGIGVPKHMGMASAHAGHLYMQTNETRNAVIHYRRSPNGELTEVERTSTGGAGSGTFKPISGQESAPGAFEGAGGVILSPDRQFLFTTNGGDNLVSSFAIGEDGRLTLPDVEATGNPVEGRSGTAKSLTYCASKGILYVLHPFGPDLLRLMSVHNEGKLTARPERYAINTQSGLNDGWCSHLTTNLCLLAPPSASQLPQNQMARQFCGCGGPAGP